MKKFQEFFDPTKVTVPIHIIGCGALGSTTAIMLARCGISDIHLWDFDTVEEHNIANQQYVWSDVDELKVVALTKHYKDIAPRAQVTAHGAWDDDTLRGIVFLCLDHIDTRKRILKHHWNKSTIDAMLDIRMRLKDATHHAAAWDHQRQKDSLKESMNFTHEEARANTPVSACNMPLSIMPTVQTVCSVAVANMVNYFNKGKLSPLVLVNPFDFIMEG